MPPAMTATVIPRTPGEIHTKRADLIARAKTVGWSQNHLARRIGADVGHFSRVLRGLLVSAPCWRKADAALRKEERRRAARRRAA